MSTVLSTPFASSTLVGLSLLLCPLMQAADALPEGVQVAYCRETLNTLSLSPGINVATVAKVKFFITADGGRSWVLGAEVIQPPTSTERPRFPFKVDHDGVYGVMTSVTYRDGRAEVEPRPGQAPQYALVIDSTPPTITRFDAALTGATVNRSVVHCSWSTSDANPAADPVAVEVSSDDGAHFTVLGHGAAAASSDLAIPIDPLVKQLLVRLVVSDRAGNVATSAVRQLAVTRPAPPAPIALAPAPPAAAPESASAPVASAAPPAAGAAAAPPGPPVTAAPVTQTPVGPAAAPAPAIAPATAPATAAPAADAGDAVSEFAQAAKALPALSDVAATPPAPLPEIAPVAQDHPPAAVRAATPTSPAATALTPAASTTATTPAAPAAPPSPAAAATPPSAPLAAAVPAAAPPAATPAAETADGPASGSNAVDQEFFDRQASSRATHQPHILQRPLPVDDAPTSGRHARHGDDGADAPAATAARAPHAATDTPAAPAAATAPSPWLRRQPPAPLATAPLRSAPPAEPSADGQRQPPFTAAFVADAEAERTLGLARIAAVAGRIDDALDLYERLFASSQARSAAAEELQLLTREKRPLDLLIVTDALPRELLSDAVRLEHGRALLTLGHPDLALATLSRIGSRAPEARDALLLMAHAYRALGQQGEARKVLEFLARGSDAVAAQAAGELARSPR